MHLGAERIEAHAVTVAKRLTLATRADMLGAVTVAPSDRRARWTELDRHDRLRVVAGGIALVVVIVAFGHYYRYHQWPGQNLPSEVSSCGREYRQGTTETGLPGEVAMHKVSRYAPPLAPHHDVYAPWASANGSDDGGFCSTVIFLRDGDSYVAYSLEGGP